jgi:hypothetical protein
VLVLSKGPSYFEAVIEVPQPVLAPASLGGRDAVRLDLPGWTSAGVEGAPALPLRSYAVAIPEGESFSISVTGESPASYSDILLLPFWSGAIEDLEAREYPVEAASDDAYSRDAALPSSLYRAGEPCYLRDLRLVPIDVSPARYNARTGDLEVFRRLRVRVETSGSGAGPALRRPDAGGWERIYSAAVLNYPSDMAARALRERRSARAGVPEDYFDDGDGWVAVEVVERGIYSVSYEDLAAAGLSGAALQSIDPASIRLFSGGGLELDVARSVLDTPDWMTEHAILVEDGGDGGFDAGDKVIFYGLGADGWSDYLKGGTQWDGYNENLRTASNVYWLTWGSGFSAGAPARMQSVDGTPGVGEASEPDMYKARVHVEENRVWEPGLRYSGIRWERWWWQLLKISDIGGRAYRVTLNDVVSDEPCRLQARFWGDDFSWGSPSLPHHWLELSFNGSDKFWRTGQQRNRIDVDTTAAWAIEGQNEFVARVYPIEDPTLEEKGQHRADEIYFAWFELEYYRRFIALDGELAFDWIGESTGPTRFTVSGFDDEPVYVFDVSDRALPVRIGAGPQSPGTVTFEQNTTGARADYYLAAESALKAPARIEARTPGSLRARTEPVDYIVISGGGLEGAAEVLADWRRTNLLGVTDGGSQAAVEVVDVVEIFDEFSWGLVDPVAIRNFLEHRFRSVPGGGRPPSYAVVLGDATWDFRDFYDLGVTNVVPSYDESFDRLTNSQYSSDDFLVLFEGPGDRFSDMAIGRLCAETPGEAMEMVTEKIIGFETGAERGPWRSRVLLAADDECIELEVESRGCKHTEQADGLSKRHIPRAFDKKKIYMIEYGGAGCVDVSKPEARRDFIEAINAGAVLINYVGHGSGNILAQERLFFADDVASLENAGRLGLFVTASCAVAKFDVPLEIGIAEGMVRAGDKGALAAYGATTLAFVAPNKELNAWLCEELLPRPSPDDSVNVGEAITLGLTTLLAESTFRNWFYETPYKYALLGDPGSVLAVPGTAYPSTGPRLHVGLDLSSPALQGGKRDTLRGMVLDGESVAAWFDGKVDVLVEGAETVKELCLPDTTFEPYTKPGPPFFRGVASVSGGVFELSWVTPYELIAGDGGRIRAFAWNAERDALGALVDLKVTAAQGPREDEEGPAVELSFGDAGGRVTPGSALAVKVSDPSGVNLAPLLAENALFLRLYNDDLNELVDGPVDLAAVFTYEEGSSSTGSAVYVLPPGLSTDEGTNSHRIEVSASDNYSNRSTARVSFEVSGEGGLELSDVVNYPNPFSSSTTIGFRVGMEADVVVRIYTVSGRHIRTFRSPGITGWGQFVWDGEDSAGDEVSNGVYLYKVTATPAGGEGEASTHVGKAVVLR